MNKDHKDSLNFPLETPLSLASCVLDLSSVGKDMALIFLSLKYYHPRVYLSGLSVYPHLLKNEQYTQEYESTQSVLLQIQFTSLYVIDKWLDSIYKYFFFRKSSYIFLLTYL